MSYVSPWQNPVYRGAVSVLRAGLRLLRRDETDLVDRLVEANNRRVHRHLERRTAGSVLLILPRCVKRSCCRPDPEGTLEGCLDCRDCALGDLARIAAAHDVRALVAFRSHIAYAMARRERPDLIIATACGDRLVKALRSVPDIPALLSPLTGMERRCVNADFDLDWFEAQIVRATAAREEERRVSRAQAGA